MACAQWAVLLVLVGRSRVTGGLWAVALSDVSHYVALILRQASWAFSIQSWQGFNSKQEAADKCEALECPGLTLTDATSYGSKQDTGQLGAREGKVQKLSRQRVRIQGVIN